MLSTVPLVIIEGFFAALNAAVTACTSTDDADLLIAMRFFDSSRLVEPRARTRNSNFVYLQSLILIIIACENSGPSQSRDIVWYAEAIRVAIYLRLHLIPARHYSEGHDDDDDAIGRRLWLIMAILDRWHAASTNGMLLIARESIELEDCDESWMGPFSFHLTRKHFILYSLLHSDRQR